MSDPDFIGIAGDWHGNTRWAVSAIRQMCKRLPDGPKVILQAGDFGVWHPPGEEKWAFAGAEHTRRSYLSTLDDTLAEQDATLWFCDGNHEDHPLIAELGEWPTPRIRYLARGTRWEWHGRTWLAVGGAVSVDRLLRSEGIGWFPEEEITDEQEAAIIAGGRADVLLSHDAPVDAPFSLGVPPQEWLPMIPVAEEHRERMQRICSQVKPAFIFHGHYHLVSQRTVRAAWGRCAFTALDMDGSKGNWGILDTQTMQWEW